MHVGEGEALLQNAFRRARLAAPSIIFFDEADVAAAKRGGKSSSNIAVGERLLSTLLTERDGLEQAKGIIVLAATNRPHAIDAALMRLGRFDLIVRKSLKPALTIEEVNAYSSFMKNPSLISSCSVKSSGRESSEHNKSLVGPVSIGLVSFLLLADVPLFEAFVLERFTPRSAILWGIESARYYFALMFDANRICSINIHLITLTLPLSPLFTRSRSKRSPKGKVSCLKKSEKWDVVSAAAVDRVRLATYLGVERLQRQLQTTHNLLLVRRRLNAADGQNSGNFITDRPSTKVHAAPGGGSSLGYLFGGGGN
ncbi:hypothetical protein Vadar_023406 [Vaccinium darrowii]|uniref:Uncharacterized protein n=1 Tax=Vaccinium darrowii TaxID=229202 RepID=A0ACB7XJN9_9ERIC|nr:hypothetical protein Vadar_023406 [Vaccinium darrowii]